MIKYYPELLQGSDEWFSARCGILTASEIKHILTPAKLQISKSTDLLYELMAQRITKYVEPSYISNDMIRGHEDEISAKEKYAENYAPTTDMGFITNNKWGYTIGFSPDWLVGDDGQAECKSRLQKFQVETIAADEVPVEFMLQIQTGLLVSERKWCDFVSYCGGLPMFTKRVYPDPKIRYAILDVAEQFEEKMQKLIKTWNARIEDKSNRLIPTERRKPEEDIICD